MNEIITANNALTAKITGSQKPTAEEYANVLNLNMKAIEEAGDPITVMLGSTFVAKIWQSAEDVGYTVTLDENAGTFSVKEVETN